MNQWFERLTEQVALAHEEAAIRSVLEKLSKEAGFRTYAYLKLRAETHTAISNYPLEWQKRYFDKNYAQIDPIVKSAKGSFNAFSWSNEVSHKISKEQRMFHGEASEFGIRSGLTVPVRTGFGRMSLLTLASEEPDFATELIINPTLAATSVAQLHSRLENLRVIPPHPTSIKMKSDELTCLRWSAEGKSMKAISVIENTSYANVVFYLRNAKAALGATTLPQATAMAKELGLI